MSLKMIFLTQEEDIIVNLTGRSYSTGNFIFQLDEKCKFINARNLISNATLYNDIDYSEKDTDIGTVKFATIQVSLK